MSEKTLHELLKAYALGKLSGTERQEVEKTLKNDPFARRLLKRIRYSLHQSVDPDASIEFVPEPKGFFAWRGWKWLLAACFVLLVVALAGLIYVKQQEYQVAKENKQRAMEAEMAFATHHAGIERFLITDINNPAASASSDSALRRAINFKDPEVQKIVMLHANDGDRMKQDLDRYLKQRAAEGDDSGILKDYLRLAQKVPSRKNVPPPNPYNDPSLNYWPGHNTESYAHIEENDFKRVAEDPLSTFSIDVDTASYANVRRLLNHNMLPPPDAVRIEEFVNYFTYAYAPPDDKTTPFAAHATIAGCPWNPKHRLARVGLKGWEMPKANRPASNFVFLIDVSGSMSPQNKLPLVQRSLKMLTKQLDERDRVAMVVYAGASGLVLPSTPADNQRRIQHAIGQLRSGGSTNGGAGIELAYRIAAENYIEGGVNRVILATDGDFNVGITDQGSLVRLIEAKAKSNIFLTVLGYGMGNLKDSTIEMLADKGNGNYAYIDTFNEAKKVLKRQLTGTLVTIAKDVKIQIEFNPAQVGAYRLIGYENRMLAAQDFNDDTKDAGEIGAGHTVTALYEIVPAGHPIHTPGIDPLKYQQPQEIAMAATSGEWFTLKIRYKQPEGQSSKLISVAVSDEGLKFKKADADFRFAAAVASFAMQLRQSSYAGEADFKDVLKWAGKALGEDPHGYREEFITLVEKAMEA